MKLSHGTLLGLILISLLLAIPPLGIYCCIHAATWGQCQIYQSDYVRVRS